MPRGNNSQRTLDNHLTLHGWLNSHFGYKTTRDLLNDVKIVSEGFNADAHSLICEFLISRAAQNSAFEQKLRIFDDNIKRHLSVINDKRTQPIALCYFQYLALFYTEIFLDWKFNRPEEFLHHLNLYVQNRNDARAPGDALDASFTADNLEKLAYWMATGAGKTLIMHINYHQYLHYSKELFNHIVLITPNEGLSEQHLRELAHSDIPCGHFNVEGNRLAHNAMRVIEITKLVEEKKSGGVSVPVEAFEGNNLIFVDEGHKGSGGKVWRKYREDLAETGFTFEYSATFGQALAAAKNSDLVEEYGKAIVFDYSYKYFYSDGYGKNFHILNVRHDDETQTETLLLGNLLSFYEQRRYFKHNTNDVRAYGLDSPLWAFVGSKVNAVYTENYHNRSDILNVIRFLHRFLKNEGDWAIHTIAKILNGNSGLSDDSGIDVFHNRFNYLKRISVSPAQLFAEILHEVFHTETSGALHLYDIRNAKGEIGLKSTGGTDYFGVINIGDTTTFKKLVKNDESGILNELEDVLAESLFNYINEPNSRINLLIGAKKFIEGWDSWRVTAMGLLNIGMQEGSQIIQLFGRGVRLRGKDMSLKRSAVLDGEHPPNLPLLETLNIFAVRANFMAQFRNYLMREGVEIDDPIQLEIPIVSNEKFLARRLAIPTALPYNETAKGECILLAADKDAFITHTTQTVEIIGSSSQEGIRGSQSTAALERKIEKESLELANWEGIYLELLEYKQEKQLHNLIFDIEILKRILCPNEDLYKLSVMDESEVVPTSLAELERLQGLVLTLLRKYIAKFYHIIQKRWNEESVQLKQLRQNDANFADCSVYVPRNEASETVPRIKRLMESGEIYGAGSTALSTNHTVYKIYNDRHLYQPLLAIDAKDTVWRTVPPALQESERHFVQDLDSYVCQIGKSSLASKEIFFLRNQSRGKGIGFYLNEGFYPDFILWITEGVKQRIVFIEPHGMIHDAINEHNEKITLFKRLRALSQERFRKEHVQMDSFIISKTDFNVLRRREGMDKHEFAEQWHILFRSETNPSYLAPIFQGISA